MFISQPKRVDFLVARFFSGKGLPRTNRLRYIALAAYQSSAVIPEMGPPNVAVGSFHLRGKLYSISPRCASINNFCLKRHSSRRQRTRRRAKREILQTWPDPFEMKPSFPTRCDRLPTERLRLHGEVHGGDYDTDCGISTRSFLVSRPDFQSKSTA
jgi:hypothetical protein